MKETNFFYPCLQETYERKNEQLSACSKNRFLSPQVFLFFLVSLWLVFLAGCGAGETDQSPKPPAFPLPEEGEPDLPAEPEPAFRAPLTGLPMEKPVTARVVGVMIENQAKARPQSGLGQADWVFEILAEGWITRFVALYQSQSPEHIGPVRSLRPYFLDVLEGLDAVAVHAGGSPEALQEVSARGYDNLDEIGSAGRYFWREDFRRMPHNLYTDMTHLREGIAAKGYATTASDLPSLYFWTDEEVLEGAPAARVGMQYHSTYRVSYLYDEARHLYLRETDGEPHMDWVTGEQLGVRNVLVIEAPHRFIQDDQKGRREVQLTGEGDGYLFQGGMVQPVSWHREEGGFFTFNDQDGPIRLLPGNTWVNVIPDQPGLEESLSYGE